MQMYQENMLTENIGEEFIRPVESIMKCEDFKSNFARKLSNRYITRSPLQDNALKLARNNSETDGNASERIEYSQLSKSVNEQIGAAKAVKNTNMECHTDMRNTEVNLLKLEVKTLRWQLSQTEANRQMHIDLLKQVVNFLSRVKEHIDCKKPSNQNDDNGIKNASSFNVADLPRSRSALQVYKCDEYGLLTPKKHSSKKISKSISNMYGFQHALVRNTSRLVFIPEIESKDKMTDEISRLIVLANTVLSTKLPDLTNNVGYKTDNIKSNELENNIMPDLNAANELTNHTIDSEKTDTEETPMPENPKDDNRFVQNVVLDTENTNVLDTENTNVLDTENTSDIENEIARVKIENIDAIKPLDEDVKSQNFNDKPNEYYPQPYIEDESGFSSMSSFQEIGIPIISIIPPSPCKETDFDIPDLLNDTNWDKDTLVVDEDSVKVFWV